MIEWQTRLHLPIGRTVLRHRFFNPDFFYQSKPAERSNVHGSSRLL